MTSPSPRRPAPTLDVERDIAARLGAGARTIVGLDEVGRGALAGPVVMGACAVSLGAGDRHETTLPDGVRDSKLLTPRRREALIAPIRAAALATAVGAAEPEEIDEVGIVDALARAALRALDGLGLPVDAVLLDGSADVLSAALADRPAAPRVITRVKADRDCASVAAASVLAKVHRDGVMTALHEQAPAYAWAANKGYGSAAHREAIARHGVHPQHRRSWNLGGGRTGGNTQSSAAAAGVLWESPWPPESQKEPR